MPSLVFLKRPLKGLRHRHFRRAARRKARGNGLTTVVASNDKDDVPLDANTPSPPSLLVECPVLVPEEVDDHMAKQPTSTFSDGEEDDDDDDDSSYLEVDDVLENSHDTTKIHPQPLFSSQKIEQILSQPDRQEEHEIGHPPVKMVQWESPLEKVREFDATSIFRSDSNSNEVGGVMTGPTEDDDDDDLVLQISFTPSFDSMDDEEQLSCPSTDSPQAMEPNLVVDTKPILSSTSEKHGSSHQAYRLIRFCVLLVGLVTAASYTTVLEGPCTTRSMKASASAIKFYVSSNAINFLYSILDTDSRTMLQRKYAKEWLARRRRNRFSSANVHFLDSGTNEVGVWLSKRTNLQK